MSQAIDLIGDRWTLSIIFQSLIGRRRFVDFVDALPRIPRATLSKRLKLLVQAEVLDRVEHDDKTVTYELTPSGEELWPAIQALGVWGERWIRELITDDAVDPAKIMWDIRRKLDPARMPDDRVVVRFEFVGAPVDRRLFWVVLDRNAPDLCMIDPGFGDDLIVRTRPGPMGAMWLGDRTMADLVEEGVIVVDGLPRLARQLPEWLGTSGFASVERPTARPRPDPTGVYKPPG